MSLSVGFIMDAGMLVLLAATVFLAFRLSMSLRDFRESRSDMEGLVNHIAVNISQAEAAVSGMQNVARKTGLELDEIINDAKKLADELRVMNDSGNNLAGRLEKLAEKNRSLIEQMEQGAAAFQASARQVRKPQQYEVDEEPAPRGGFSIRDRDADNDLSDEAIFGSAGMPSKAERELLEALQGSKTRRRSS
ncbi:MAG: hypothetical protein DI626_06325 [Micavibrio aeruginosavorus]|uniref:DUF6468 domain-containing protein n=1 Tax=Micavibrio aeruginosavorus TaxID=349221 RepID=A0A2W4ZW56_9BACT|nr:MAG: hypothetical protein DI626_06325 [Micavibrio aeruginosavorus]